MDEHAFGCRHTGLQFMVDPGADASIGGMVGEKATSIQNCYSILEILTLGNSLCFVSHSQLVEHQIQQQSNMALCERTCWH